MSAFRGDYRTGKRLNMRKVIPYIASQFRKDKIWLRRTKPNKRNYQVRCDVTNRNLRRCISCGFIHTLNKTMFIFMNAL